MAFFRALDGRTRLHPRRHAAQDDARWRDEIFKAPPATSAQILHPEAYLANKRPAGIPPFKNAHDRQSAVNVIGEFGISATLTPALGEKRAADIAAGWNGDRLLISESVKKGERTLDWITQWETPRAAGEFARALEEALAVHDAGALTWRGKSEDRQGTAKGARLEIVRPESGLRVELIGSFPSKR
jgi:hypothetical protein